MKYAQAAAAMRRFLFGMRGLSGALASARTGYPLLHELDEIEWPFGDRRSYYGDHPYVRAFERRYPRDHLIRGAARVLYAPVTATPPTKLADLIPENGWTELGTLRADETITTVPRDLMRVR